ncbi:MAG: hypothetical protein L3J82_03620 [Planctomycetes bacterium]|nr:hypothetical protein [Planctomycetota bacterium]
MAKNKKRRNKPNVRVIRTQSKSRFETVEERAQELYLKQGGELLDLCIKSARACLELFHLELEDYTRGKNKLTVSAGVAMRATAQLARYRREKTALWNESVDFALAELAPPELIAEPEQQEPEPEQTQPEQTPEKVKAEVEPAVATKISPVPALTG